MNQVEQWFSIRQRKRLVAPNFADLDVLEERVLAFIAELPQGRHRRSRETARPCRPRAEARGSAVLNPSEPVRNGISEHDRRKPGVRPQDGTFLRAAPGLRCREYAGILDLVCAGAGARL